MTIIEHLQIFIMQYKVVPISYNNQVQHLFIYYLEIVFIFKKILKSINLIIILSCLRFYLHCQLTFILLLLAEEYLHFRALEWNSDAIISILHVVITRS